MNPTSGSSSTVDAATDAPAPPVYIRPNFDRMPAELKLLKNWLLWAAVWNGKKWTKRPIQVSGYGASTINKKHWSSFDAAQQAYACAVARGYMELRERGKPVQQAPVGGIGFVFDGQPGADGLVFAGVDFDKVISGGEIASLAQERIRRLGSYTEQSVSRGGLHVIVKARPLASGVAHGGVEMYTSGRYFTMTGRAPKTARIVDAAEPFAALANELQGLAGSGAQDGAGTTSANYQQKDEFAAYRERPRNFGDADDSLSDGIETNIEKIRSAVSAIPSSAISSEADWMRLARALAHEAAIYKKQSEELWKVLDSASRLAPGYNESENRSRWLRYINEAFAREKPITIATVFDLAKKHGWQAGPSPGATENAADEGEAAGGQAASAPPDLKFSLSDVPPHRPWLYSVDLVRGDLSVLASPGGAGKTSLALGMAICVALGKPLLGEKIWGSGPFTSLYINAEDSGIEMRRRARAFCQRHTVTNLDRLYIAGTDDPRVRGLSLLRPAGQNSSVLNPDGLAHLDSLLASLRPDLVIIDPLIALCGGISINDNAAMALAMQEIKRLAIKFNCSILIVCHTKKGGEPGSAEAISGASAIKDLARCARMPVTMTAAEATKFNVLPSERHQHFKLVDAKSNLALHTDDTWYKLESEELPNSELPTYPHGDRVQAVVRVKLTQSKASSAADSEQQRIRFEILKLIDRGLMIDGETVLYSPNSTGKNKIRGILDDAMAAVERVSGDRTYSPSDLRAVAERELEALKQEGWAIVEKIKKGRFRRTQGLRPVWERTPWAKEREVLREHGGPTVRTEEEEAEWKRRDLNDFLQGVTPPGG
ncbi:AAA family ATPase [Bradyrhizobium sp. AUGA SZCCT0283]|uniref:AAA family ATPase n=1 Tax=Bradyrhizobium sp. AUGA SZCCT0283 TaxID=2807671 RepID=UPI001BAAE027|nr:AAA family ATPase [Bradyrhizobium sp. AUGA SZCCT0283]MBR1275620.1 AAA family ATPase [Bradyrhizobium sp. AUGA SZCCT0283]